MPLYLVHPRVSPIEVVSFSGNVLIGRRPDGSEFRDTNFHIYMVKRSGYSLTPEMPREFARKASHELV